MENQRNYALDLLRGLTIALMIIVNNPGDWKAMFTVLRHAEWHGFLGADIVFPLFLFVAGYAAALKIDRVYAPLAASGPHCASALTLEERETPPFYLPLLRRAAILFLIGVLLNAWPFGLLPGTEFSFEKLRLFGVLQRIAICVLIGGILLRRFLTVKGLVSVLILIAAVYEIGMRVPLLQNADGFFGRSFELKDNFARFVDTAILPASMLYKVQKIPFDPEGLFTSLTAVMTFLLGGLAFRLSLGTKASRQRFVLGILLVVLGGAFCVFEPINKNLWTIPYVLFTGAVSVFLLTLLDKLPPVSESAWRFVVAPIAYMGRNPLVIYVLSGLVGKTLVLWKLSSGRSIKATLYAMLPVMSAKPEITSLLYSIILLIAVALLAILLKRTPLRV